MARVQSRQCTESRREGLLFRQRRSVVVGCLGHLFIKIDSVSLKLKDNQLIS